MRTADVVQAFPTYILIIALVFALGQGIASILVAFTIIAWVAYARLIRSEILRIRGLDYVQAARAAGLPSGRILWLHVFPNAGGQTLVYLPSDIVHRDARARRAVLPGSGDPAPHARVGSHDRGRPAVHP